MARSPVPRVGDAASKRLLDVGTAALLVLLTAPLLLVATVAVLVSSSGPVLFRHTRIGLDGRPIEVLKLRSMHLDAEERLTRMLALDPAAAAELTRFGCLREDPRVAGAVGHFLRRWSLDELPQLWNVLRGDMSLVGPRPERPHFVSEFTQQYPWYTARHRVPAGLTGWAQVHGLRGDTSIADRARFDNFYIENWSMWGDMKILLRTAGQVIRAAGR